VQLILDGVFGISAPAGAGPTASGVAASMDPTAVLRGVILGGVKYDVHADGRVERSAA
jgi:hypothetical protein